MRSLLWEGPGYDCSVKDYFIELIVEKGKLRSSPEENRVIKLGDIFVQLPEEEALQKFLIIGDPGYGKTTLCKKLAYDWATSVNYLKHFAFVIIVTLRDIKEKSINDIIIETIFQTLEKITIEEIKELDQNFLIILDGYDEVANNHSNIVSDFIEYEYQNISSKMTIVVTSRPRFVPENIKEEMEEHFSINGFDKNAQLKYIESVFQDKEIIQYLIKQLNQNEFLFNIAKCPLMLHMICCFERANYISELKRLTDLYIKMLQLIMKRSAKKYDLSKLKHGRYFHGEALLIKLGELAWNYLQNNAEITSECLKTYFPDDNEYQVVVNLDILILSSFIIEGKEIYKYDPLHRSFFEFLSSLYLSTLKKLPSKIKKIPNINYIFLSGLCDNEPLPAFCKTIRFCDKYEYNIPFLQMIYNEMKKNEENFSKFCSPINVLKVNVITDNVDILEKVMNCEKLKTLTLILPESWNGLEPIRDKLIKINFNYCNLHCFLYAGYRNAKKFALCFDIRDSISTILYIIGNIQCKHLKVYLSGLYNIDTKTFQKYKSIKKQSPVSSELQNAFDFNKTEAIIIEGKNGSSFLISCEQYDVLQKEGLFLPIFGEKRIDILRSSNM
ncbi:nucleotide-binding oligomerization domain-containing protein 2-like [Centruroides sculpturatus]|uniref:nucleotide-binding oligomerization domain-containing protein 2-like n=1 Tax=Centruroides sculpturatus TaxID=218467 RepID=UPI000C6D1176|nr:nucleotide-binding oligomerization domain-containing protein 2-like [Centruroides sculpturatus]